MRFGLTTSGGVILRRGCGIEQVNQHVLTYSSIRVPIWGIWQGDQVLKIGRYVPHALIYAQLAAQFWYWTITCITGVHCAANEPSWQRQQRRISVIATHPNVDAKCSKMGV